MLTIMITAYASIETAVTATKRGAYDFLAKPFTPDELKSTIRKAAARLILAKQARKLAEEKRQVRFEFIRVLGHELKAPLNAVAGYLRMFKERSLGDDPAAYDEGIDRSLIRIDGMQKLIADLLDLTQIESGRKNRAACRSRRPRRRPSGDRTLTPPTAAARNITLASRRRRARADDGRPRRDRDDPEQSDLQRRQVQPRRRPRRRRAWQSRIAKSTIAVADTGIGMTAEECDKHLRRVRPHQERKDRATFSAAGWAFRSSRSSPNSTAATPRSPASPTRAAPSPSN